jgi:ArsR family transcriptional regulator, arsenate/arsenite/antimonite-responsive transcriptional repressor
MANRIDKTFRAFADHNRLRILHLLSRGEQCVCDLMDVLNMGQSKVSRHLSYLKRSGLVCDRKEGLWVYYSLEKPLTKFHKRILSCLDCCLDDVPELQKDRKRLENNKKKSCC